MTRTRRAAAWLLATTLLCLGASAEETGEDLVKRARLSRLNGHPEKGAALLAPVVAASGARADAREEYILCTGAMTSTEQLPAALSALLDRFGSQPALILLRSNLIERGSGVEAAMREIDGGLASFPESLLLLVRKGQLLAQRRPEEGIEYMRSLMETHPESDRVAFMLGRVLAGAPAASPGIRSQALGCFVRAAQISPGWAQANAEVGTLRLVMGDNRSAFDSFSRAAEAAPDNLQYKLHRYEAAMKIADAPPLERERIAEEVERIVVESHRDQAGIEFAARAYEIAGDEPHLRAVEADLLDRFPASGAAVTAGIREIHELAGRGSIDAARELALKLAHSAGATPAAMRYYETIAGILSQAGRAGPGLAAVLDQWRAYLRKLPAGETPSPLAQIASDYLLAGSPEPAIECAISARSLLSDSGRSDARRDFVMHATSATLARVYFRTEHFENARPFLEELSQREAGDPAWSEMLGEIALRSGGFEEAQARFEQSYKLSFMRPEIERRLRDAFVARTRSAKGWEDYLSGVRERSGAELREEVRRSSQVTGDRLLPEFDLEELRSARRIASKDLAGKILVLNLWATWCGPCRAEMPELEKMAAGHADRDVVFLAVNAAESREQVQGFLAGMDFDLPVLLDPDPWRRFKIDAIPCTIVVDRQGRMRFALTGFDPNRPYQTVLRWLLEACQ